MAALCDIMFFDKDGNTVGTSNIVLPDFLDWMPIAAKIFWVKERGYGHPNAKRLLMTTQGERKLVDIETPLAQLSIKQLKEQEQHVYESTNRYIEEQGISRTPRNQ